MFVLKSKIIIGGFAFSGVNSIVIKKSIFSVHDSCTIKLPSVCRVKKKNSSGADFSTVSKLFNVGDKVSVNLGYNGALKNEFEGFVKSFNPMVPLEIECEGYIRNIRLNKNISGYYNKISVKKLLELAVKDTGISLYVQDDILLRNIQLDNFSGSDIISEIKKQCGGVIAIFFIEPKKIWCGLTYTPYTDGVDPFANGVAKYRLGFNCHRDNNLKLKSPLEPVQIIVNDVSSTGHRLSVKSHTAATSKKKISLQKILEESDKQKIANELQYEKNYSGYTGNIKGFLTPYVLPGYKVYILDNRYKELAGNYFVESIEVQYGTNGARRIVDIGPALSFKH